MLRGQPERAGVFTAFPQRRTGLAGQAALRHYEVHSKRKQTAILAAL